MSGSTLDFVEENENRGNSDANSDDAPEYYKLISTVEGSGSSDDKCRGNFWQLPNGFVVYSVAKNRISSLDLNNGVEKSSANAT
ncbi:pescadillo-like protein [Spatholobus suberectus]|nr:pescadillo-like protein [Spatholobus suberectus]